MAATVLTETSVAGPYVREGSAQFTTAAPAATDPTNKNTVVMSTGTALVLFRNSHAVTGYWATVEGTKDPFGRVADTGQQSLAAGEWVGRIFAAPGWEQDTGGRNLLFDSENLAVEVVVIPL